MGGLLLDSRALPFTLNWGLNLSPCRAWSKVGRRCCLAAGVLLSSVDPLPLFPAPSRADP